MWTCYSSDASSVHVLHIGATDMNLYACASVHKYSAVEVFFQVHLIYVHLNLRLRTSCCLNSQSYFVRLPLGSF